MMITVVSAHLRWVVRSLTDAAAIVCAAGSGKGAVLLVGGMGANAAGAGVVVIVVGVVVGIAGGGAIALAGEGGFDRSTGGGIGVVVDGGFGIVVVVGIVGVLRQPAMSVTSAAGKDAT
jgi:hypothetical protein